MTTRPYAALAVLAGAVSLAGCSGGGGSTASGSGNSAASSLSSTTSSSGSASASGVPSPGQDYPVAAGGQAQPEPVIGTKQSTDWAFTLNGVQRVAEDRVLVQGLVDGRGKTKAFVNMLTEPAVKYDPDLVRVNEFSAVTITAPGDTTIYLPVRDEQKRCLCSHLDPSTMEDKNAVQVLMSAPKGATTVTVSVEGIGTFTNVPVK